MQTKEPDQNQLRFAALAVDIVIFSVIGGDLNVLLIKTRREPFPGFWALPGGLVQPRETLEDAGYRHLLNKANIKDVYMEQLYTFGAINRDPRNRVVSVAYLALVAESFDLATSADYEAITWTKVKNLPHLAYDHNEIVATGLERLKAKLEYSNIVYSLMPEAFTLSQLQTVYELILEKELDKRNFRRKLLSLKIIEPVARKKTGEPNRPAQLFRFINREPQIVDVL